MYDKIRSIITPKRLQSFAIIASASLTILVLARYIPWLKQFVALSPLNAVLLAVLGYLCWDLLKKDSPTSGDVPMASDQDPQVIAELNIFQNAFEGAMDFLKKTKVNILGKDTYLEHLPWHLVIGPSGAGKSTLIANSGLKFILAKKIAGEKARKLKSTRHVDWWVTRDAVMLDTCGHFSTETTEPGLYQSLWYKLLELLNTHHHREKIESVILVLNLRDLLSRSEQKQQELFQCLRYQLQDVNKYFCKRFKLHILLNQCDQIAGFSEFFDYTDNQERAQIWGIPLDTSEDSAALELSHGIDDFLKKLKERVIWRMHHERNIEKRARIKDFPIQMEQVKPALIELVQSLPNIMDKQSSSKFSVELSGLYFTSSHQQSTPYDSLIAPMNKAFQLQPLTTFTSLRPNLNFFTEKLFKNVVFNANRIDHTQSADTKPVYIHYLGYAISGFIIIAATFSLSANFSHKLTQINKAQNALTEYQVVKQHTQHYGKTLTAILPSLNALAKANNAFNGKKRSWIVNANDKASINDLLSTTYVQRLHQKLIPTLFSIASNQMRDIVGNQYMNETDTLYDAFKTYLMLSSERSHLDSNHIKKWIIKTWQAERLGEMHDLEQLLDHVDVAFHYPSQALVANQSKISGARIYLQRLPAHQRVEVILHDKASEIQLGLRLPINIKSNPISQSSTLTGTRNTIPYLYTAEGFSKVFVKHHKAAIQEALSGNWVFGQSLRLRNADYNDVMTQLQQAYASNFMQAWDSTLGTMRIKPFKTLQQASDIISELADNKADVFKLLEITAQNTQIAQSTIKSLPSDLARIATKMNAHFHDIHEFINGEQKQVAMEALLNELADIQQRINQVVSSSNHAASAFDVLKYEFEKERRAEPLFVKPVENMLSHYKKAVWSTLVKLASQHIAQQWQHSVYSPYSQFIARHYPIDKQSSADVDMVTFTEFYGPGGKLITFYDTYLAPFVKSSDRKWEFKRLYGMKLPFHQATLAQFKSLSRFQKGFFTSSRGPNLNFSMIANAVSPSIRRFSLNINGQRLEYPNGEMSNNHIHWPRHSRGNNVASLSFKARRHGEARFHAEGAWSLFRLLDQGTLSKPVGARNYLVTFAREGYSVSYELMSENRINPFTPGLFDALKLSDAL